LKGSAFLYILLFAVPSIGAVFCFIGGFIMASRVGVISIIVENTESVESLNALLHSYGEHIIGRMGIPYREKGISLISVAIDAPQDIISTLGGKIGNLKGVSAKTVLSNVVTNE
jgi:putative iron-only hydrogenase system regulator